MDIDDVIDLTRTLVSIDSVNPSLVPGGAGEGEIGRYLERWATENDLAARVFSSDGRPNLVIGEAAAVVGATGDDPPPGRTLMLYGHMDTVGLGSMASPLEPRMDGDRLYGRGAYDQKAGLAAALVATREAARAGIPGVAAVAVADEEAASVGIQEVLRHVRTDAAVVTEPTEMAVAIAHRGFVWIEIEVRGRASHGSRPHLGVDAIFRTGPIITALERYTERLARRTEHPLLGSALLHASLIEGGSEMATLPDRCLLSVERRTLPGETAAGILAEVEEVLAACRATDPALVADARVTLARDPFEIASTDAFVQLAGHALAGATGTQPPLTGVSFWADSAFIAAAGIPTVLLGPPGEGAHADEEWVSVSGTLACTRTLVEIARDFAGVGRAGE